jgi:hypothetical protein
VRPRGAVVHLELDRLDEGEAIDVEVARERYLELALQKGDLVYVAPRSGRAAVRFGRGRSAARA